MSFRRIRKGRLAFWLVAYLLPANALAANIEVKIDRDPVLLNESFSLVFEADGPVDDDPDFSPLEHDFEILRQSQGNSMRILNGTLSQQKEWTLNLMGKNTGRFIIPSISFGNDRSRSITIEIKEKTPAQSEGDDEPIFLEVTAVPSKIFVQSQIIYTVRLYRSVNLISGNLSEPTLSDADAVIEKLGDDRAFETTRGGHRYLVVERVYAIFPQQSGRLSIAPVTFEGQIGSRPRSMFGPFNHGGTIKRLQSEALELEVSPVPQDKVKGIWLPARDLRILDKWPEDDEKMPVFKAGEPVTRTIIVVAEGLTAAHLPEIEIGLPKDFKLYPDQPVLEDKERSHGIVGTRTEKLALIPTLPGAYRIPPVEIPWWNTQTERMETAVLPGRSIEVLPSDIPEAALPTPLLDHETGVSDTELGAANRQGASGAAFWSWVSLVLGLGWVLTLVAWWGSRQKHEKPGPSTETVPPPPDTREIRGQVKKACMQNAVEAAKLALLAWGRVGHPMQPVSLGKLEKGVGPALAKEIRILNAVIYGRDGLSWQNGAQLWTAFQEETKGAEKNRVRKSDGLAPMYP